MIVRISLRAAVVLTLLPASAFATDGNLDTTFDGDGKTVVHFDLGQADKDDAWGISQFPDGRLAISGTVDRAVALDSDFGIAVLLPNGGLDSSFDGDGKATVAFDLPDSDKYDQSHAVAAMADGRVVSCGTATYSQLNYTRLAVSRLTSGGSSDTFGSSGKVLVSPFDYTDSDEALCFSLIVQKDNRIVLPFDLTDRKLTGLVRLEADGDLDPTFGGDGISEMPICPSGCGFVKVIQLTDGKFMAVGWESVEVTQGLFLRFLLLARYTSAGLLDTSFSGDGLARTHAPQKETMFDDDLPIDVALDPNGRVVVLDLSEGFSGNYNLVRFDSNGAVDTAFGSGGWTEIELRSPPAPSQLATGLLIQGDGQIVVTGSFEITGTDWDCAAMRFNASAAALDSSFGIGGRRSIPFDLGTSSDIDECHESVAGDGRPVLVGTVWNGDDRDFAVARLTNAYIFSDGFESQSTYFWSGQVP